MATVEFKIFKHHKKSDGTYNVKIRVSHRRDKRYFDTPHFVSERQLFPDLTIKDAFLKKALNSLLDEHRLTISCLGDKLELFTAETLRDYLRDKNQVIDFIKFSQLHVRELFNAGRPGSAKTLQTVVLSLADYFNRQAVAPMEINEQMLSKYERYLRSPRKITRDSKLKKAVTRTVKGMTDAGVHNHLRDLRILFKAAMKYYNKPHLNEVPIPYCPFDNYKIVDTPETKKRNITIDVVKQIRDFKVKAGSRAELGRDLFMLSFYLCGMNAVDIYELENKNIIEDRIEYQRRKTKSRRKDKAFISIQLIKPAKILLDKYLGNLGTRYGTFENLDRGINTGLKDLCKALKIPPITFYWARHTFASIARNKCRLSKDDVALALNHVDNGHKVTDIYIEKDWTIVDDVQCAVTNLLKISENKVEYQSAQSYYHKNIIFILDEVVLPQLIAG